MKLKNSFLQDNIMIVAIFFFSGAYIAGKFAIQEVPPIELTCIRFLLSGVILFILLIASKKELTVPKSEIVNIIILSLLGMVGYHSLYFEALKYTSATNASLLSTTTPVITSILAWIFLKEKLTFPTICGILISFIGLMLLLTNGSIDVLKHFRFNKGDIYMMISIVSFSFYLIKLKRTLLIVNPFTLTTYVFLICGIVLLPITVVKMPLEVLKSFSGKTWFSIFYLSIFASVIGYLVQQISTQKIGPVKTSLYTNITPIFSMILAYIFLNEKITVIKVISAIIIIAGVVIATQYKRRIKF